MSAIRWFLAAEAKRARVAHRADHVRLGQEFSKCGKRLGKDVTKAMIDRPRFDPCRACIAEVLKDAERLKAVAEMAAADKQGAIPNIKPRAYDLAKPAELRRLLFEVTGYMRTSLRDGTDIDGRQFALDALEKLGKRVRARGI